MNVLLVPAHPGFPGQIPQSRKTVVVVVVVMLYWELGNLSKITYAVHACFVFERIVLLYLRSFR